MKTDVAGRLLDPEERRAHDRLLPALKAWQAYLDANGAVAEFEAAMRDGRPILLRHRCTLETNPAHYCPRAVAPTVALQWARRNGHGGRAGTGTVLTLSAMVQALEYMRARRATTFKPMDDERDRRRRDGFWRLTSEITARLRQGAFTPVLAEPPGRVPADRIPVPARVAAAGRSSSPDMTVTLLRHFLDVRPVTALLSTAVAEGRPLATRPPGRTPMSASRGALVRTDTVMASVDALLAHAAEFADQIGILPMSRAEMKSALQACSIAQPVAQFSALDAGQQRKVRDWWRIEIAPLRLRGELVDRAALLDEFEYWRRTSAADRTEPATGREPVTEAYPPGFDPSWANDPDMREVYGLPPLEDDE